MLFRTSLAVTASLLCFVTTTGDEHPPPVWVMLAVHTDASLFRFHCLANDSMLLTNSHDDGGDDNDDVLSAASLSSSSSSSCCALVQEAMHRLLLLLLHNADDDNELDSTRTVKKNFSSTTRATIITAIQDDCLRNNVQVPLVPARIRPSLYPTHSYFYNSQINKTSPDRSDIASFTTRPERDWNMYLHNGNTNVLHAINNSEIPREFQSLLLTNNESSSSSMDDSFRAMLISSELSQSGGMHRLWRQRIQLGKDIMIPADRRTNQLQLYMLLHLPADFFVDMEDTFEPSSDDSMQLELVTLHKDTVVDIEEPAFASPAHAMLVRLAKTNLQSDDEFLSFVIKIHLRYPQPVGDHDDEGMFRKVVLPAPMLVAGYLEWRHTSNPEDMNQRSMMTTTTTTTFRLSPWSTTMFVISGQQHPPMLETWVAAGRAQDLLPVLFITLVVAVTGTVVMMRDILRVAKWDI